MAPTDAVLTGGNHAGATVPGEVVLHRSDLANPRFTPRELRLIKEHVGRSLSDVLGDEADDSKFVVFAWLKLRRDGYDVAWEDMDDVVLAFVMEEPTPDPTPAPPATTSPPSVATGG